MVFSSFFCWSIILTILFLFLFHFYLLGALIRNHELVRLMKLQITGIDYNLSYVKQANAEIQKNQLECHIRVEYMSVYDYDAMCKLVGKNNAFVGKREEKFDSAYFSGSLSLMPDPVKALLSVANLVKPGGKIYVTQTFQKESMSSRTCNWILQRIKPRLKLFTTIDFGRLLTNSDILHIYDCTGLILVEHDIIPSSVDNIFQAAYLSILEVPY